MPVGNIPFSIQGFHTALTFGGARQNLFSVTMPFPPVAPGQTGQFAFMCKAASLPPEQLGTIAVPFLGRVIKVPGDRTFQEWTVTVINDETFQHRNTFEVWSNAINAHNANVRNPAAIVFPGFQVKATVSQYSKTGLVVKEYNFINLWPSAVSEIATSWDANDQIEDFQVTFEYDWFESNTTL